MSFVDSVEIRLNSPGDLDARLLQRTADKYNHFRAPCLAVSSTPSYNTPPCEALMLFSIHPSRRFLLTYISGFMALIILLVLNSGSAYAEWMVIGYSESLGGYTVYVDPDTIRRKGDHQVKVWTLTNYTSMQTVAGHSFLSSKVQSEFDCAEELQHELAVTWFSGDMGNGNGVWHSSDETKWRPVAPGSVGEGVWKFACGCAIAPCHTPPLT